MSRVADDTLGRRRFQVRKEKAVEHALERIRRAKDSGWRSCSDEDYAALREVLGEIWINVDRERWETYSFAKLTGDEVHSLIAAGRDLRSGDVLNAETLAALDAILGRSPVGP
ncbi:MAG: hypothetical protein ABSB80_01855 [Methanoregula sp.]|jgi:hypothetical protein|uniref:hypothetical protein n=1 Tax=Methanoregula sp. TaxID=2052170 RepID=UPI003D0D50B1